MAGIIKSLIVLACTIPILCNSVYAQSGFDETRGELLYSIHCISCHDSEIHWREKKLVTNWDTLKDQVERWQGNLALDWNDNDIIDVTGYLNLQFYHYPVMLKNGLSENDR
ncbi:MAG: hypothetical protein MRK00_11565 [Nitrosomonas sp.]|nr:hypothetical protein [Nitrosomonas sp.]